MTSPEDILSFWLDEVGPEGWYSAGAACDARVTERFADAWAAAARGAMDGWLSNPRGALALVVLLDQFPRNMFRGEARAFATDALARSMAKHAIDHGWDMRIPEPERQFFYLPLMHSESLCDQDRGVRMFLTRMPDSGADNLVHAKAHRDVIRRFGRFPYRNAALGRETTPGEAEFLGSGGYGATLRRVRSEAEAA